MGLNTLQEGDTQLIHHPLIVPRKPGDDSIQPFTVGVHNQVILSEPDDVGYVVPVPLLNGVEGFRVLGFKI